MPLVSSRTAAEIDEEIREEFAFHLEMRTQDNLQAGMSPEAARRDAEQRFGDVELSRHACRKITLGPRHMFQRMQTLLLAALLVAVVYLGWRSVNLESANSTKIKLLSATIERLQSEQHENAPTKIPYLHWKPVAPSKSLSEGASNSADLPANWGKANRSLDQPWSDWGHIPQVRPHSSPG